jgi:hypothetical protein
MTCNGEPGKPGVVQMFAGQLGCNDDRAGRFGS